MLTRYAGDPQKGLTRKDLKKIPLRIWSKPAAEGDHEGPLPCDHGEEYFPCDDQEYHKMKQYVEEKLVSHRLQVKESDKLEASQTAQPVENRRIWPKQRLVESRSEL